MPLSMVREGEACTVQNIKSKDSMYRRLCEIGIVNGAEITVISSNPTSLMIKVGEARFALSKVMAHKVLVNMN